MKFFSSNPSERRKVTAYWHIARISYQITTSMLAARNAHWLQLRQAPALILSCAVGIFSRCAAWDRWCDLSESAHLVRFTAQNLSIRMDRVRFFLRFILQCNAHKASAASIPMLCNKNDLTLYIFIARCNFRPNSTENDIGYLTCNSRTENRDVTIDLLSGILDSRADDWNCILLQLVINIENKNNRKLIRIFYFTVRKLQRIEVRSQQWRLENRWQRRRNVSPEISFATSSRHCSVRFFCRN